MGEASLVDLQMLAGAYNVGESLGNLSLLINPIVPTLGKVKA